MPGKIGLSTAQIDEDYQMIDSHLDKVIKKKIQNFEYIDFSKIISKTRPSKEDEQRLEIVNRNGMTYLAPVAGDSIQINTYNRWEQAFRIYSNIITAWFPEKASELLQYNHTIHMASMTYVWENVYAYDREFRHHISHHPEH